MARNSFKQELNFEERRIKAERLRRNNPDSIPVIVERAEKSDVPNLDKKKFLFPGDMTVGGFVCFLRKTIKLSAEKAIFILVDNMLPSTGALMSTIDAEKKDEDGFLYIIYSGENTFGSRIMI